MNAIAPTIGVTDTRASIAFYTRLGFTALPATGGPRVLLYDGDFALMLTREQDLRGWLAPHRHTPVGKFGTLYLGVDDFEATVARFRPHVEVVKEVARTAAGGPPAFYFRDPDGYVIGVSPKQQVRKEW
ncbi:VOC family protein [Nocardia crassostreae]|uniref:VOC family protein n=1 Tax=Nocardia crassostreae TaxID=53428 RepID=UPI000830E99B|nr:VOC family protein [Nocardia crassostreae]